MNKLFIGLLAATSLFITACSNTSEYRPPKQVNVIAELKEARAELHGNLISRLSATKPIIAASFANIDNLSMSSTFGRMAAEVMAAGFTNGGYQVIEVKMRDSLFIKQKAGEFILSRKLQDISKEHDAQAVLLGTYAIGGSNLYISARIVRTRDNVVIASHDFSLPLNRDIKHMIGRQKR